MRILLLHFDFSSLSSPSILINFISTWVFNCENLWKSDIICLVKNIRGNWRISKQLVSQFLRYICRLPLKKTFIKWVLVISLNAFSFVDIFYGVDLQILAHFQWKSWHKDTSFSIQRVRRTRVLAFVYRNSNASIKKTAGVSLKKKCRNKYYKLYPTAGTATSKR